MQSATNVASKKGMVVRGFATPQDKELMIVGEDTVGHSEEFADAINAVYRAYIDRLGIFCWSAVFAFPPINKRGNQNLKGNNLKILNYIIILKRIRKPGFPTLPGLEAVATAVTRKRGKVTPMLLICTLATM